MIKNVIFDIGNVLAGFVWREFYQSFDFDAVTQERLAAATVLSPLWDEIDLGSMTTEAIIQGFKENDPPMSDIIDLVFADISGMVARFDYAVPWLRELKEQGYEVYIISNISEKIVADCGEALDFLPLAAGIVFSYREKLMKPDEAIFQLFLHRYELKADECVFIDDQEKNIIAARAQGIEGILFSNYQQARAGLNQFLKIDGN